jgi:pyridoxal phosphate-dependent aminotransferase EpsN
MTGQRKRIYLSVPHMGGNEIRYVQEAFDTNWLSTVGPNLNAFEKLFQERIGLPAVALASGTAAMHLALRLVGVTAGDEVFSPTLTFVGGVNPILFLGAKPVFLDSETRSWNLDPNVLETALKTKADKNRLPRALIVTHLFGQCADMDPILSLCARYDVPVVEDAAEAIGSLYESRPAGVFSEVAAFSFNGNKIITTSGGGMLVSKNLEWVEKARFWSQQARDSGVAYEHSEVGYNYRMSNVLAGMGRGQMEVLDEHIRLRRAVAFRYRDAFAGLDGIEFAPQAPYGFHTNWLSCFLIDDARFGADRDTLIHALAEENIEARPVWKPMHLQRLFEGAERFGGTIAEDIFRRGICLPSSSCLPEEDQDLVIALVRQVAGQQETVPLHDPTDRC